MPYLGHSPTNAGSFIEIDDYGSSFNGSTTAFTLQVGGVDVTPNAQNLLVMIDGVMQMPGSAYSVSGSTITYTEAPASGADSYVVLMGQSASIGQGTIGADELKVSGNGSSGQVLTSDGDGTFSWATDTEPYLPLAGGTMTGTLILGDLDIIPTSSNVSVIKHDSGSGSLTLQGDQVNIKNRAGNETGLSYNDGGGVILSHNSKVTSSSADTTFKIETTSGTTIFPVLDFVSSHSSVGAKIRQDGSDVITIDNDQDVTFADDVTVSGVGYFGTTASYIKQSRFGYSSSYKVLQLGLATSTSAISLGADVSGNNSGGFTGNEILIPNARGILAPNNANNAFLGVLAVTSSDTIEIGRGNHSIVNTSGNAISISTSTNHVSLNGGQSDYSTLGIHTGGTNTYSATGNTHHTDSAITIDFPNADQSYGAIRWRSHGNMEQFFGVVQQGSSGQGDWVWQGFDGSSYDERMRLSEEGLLAVKWGIDSYGLYLNGLPSSSTKGILLACGPAAGTVDAALFRDGNGHNCGAIYLDATNNTTNYSTSSDYRLKENEEIIPDGIERIKKLKPYKFNFKSNPDKTKVDGFFAHELAEHIPEAVDGEKDQMEDGEIKPQSVDYGKVTPLLVKAVQELIAKVEALENA